MTLKEFTALGAIKSISRISHIIPFITLAILVGLTIWAIDSNLQKQNALTINNKDNLIMIENKTVKAGDILDLLIPYCLNTSDPVLIKRTIRDNEVINLDDSVVPILLDTGCHTITQQIQLDDNMKPDTYNITFYFTIPTINFGKIYKTQEFQIN